MFGDVRRIFFDSGMVLLHPRSGDWFYPAIYREYCARRGLPEKSLRQSANFRVAYVQLARERLIETEDAEYEAFLRFYATLFHKVDGKDRRELVESCAAAAVRDYDKYEFYDDVPASIKRLTLKYDLGIISDAWPSLEGVYRKNDMRKYFEPFIISSRYGCTKEGPDLFRFALANVADHPEHILFVDDSTGNCRRAARAGMQVVVLNRSRYRKARRGMPQVADMPALEAVLDSAAEGARAVPGSW
jgi:haloacid dehalogenase superfamily, subfamily IA, variant 3 with third motif having DD or ED